jgi:CrcB protein
MARFLWVCVGGAVGTGARYAISGWAARRLGGDFPYGTLLVNVAGSFVIALIMQLSLTTGLVSPSLRVVLAVGVMGGFTTYSAFNYETLDYLQSGAWLMGSINVLAMVIACLVAGLAGLASARLLFGS